MKIDKKLIKELVDNLKEFELTELEYQDGQTKIKVSKAAKGVICGFGADGYVMSLKAMCKFLEK